MITRFLQVCAASALLVSSAFAGNAAGTYSAQTKDGNLVIELRPLQDNLLLGTVHYANKDFPLSAKQVGDNLNGTWEGNGHFIPFTSTLNGHTLTLTTNGATYALEKIADPLPGAPEAIAPATAPAGDIPKAQTRQGREFDYDVPQGWSARESEGGVDLASRDGVTSISHCLWIAPGQSNPQEVLDLVLTQASAMKWRDVKIESVTPLNQGNDSGNKYILSYKFNGIPVKAEMVVIVYNEARRNVDRVVVLQARPEVLERNEKTMMALAHKIVVTHPELIDPDAKKPQPQPQQPQPQPENPAPAFGANPRPEERANAEYKARQQLMDRLADEYEAVLTDRDKHAYSDGN